MERISKQRKPISVKLSDKEYKFIKRASKERKQPISTFIRSAGINQAMGVLEEDFK